MGISKRILSAVIAGIIGCAQAAATFSYAAEDSISATDYYDTISLAESKGVSQETDESPFKVFDIYNAYCSAETTTTTTTTLPTTTTTTTTT
ncbi:MAG: hypothetical protein II690_04210, partial [Ruminococcus sp.]|nr:hypothetical protein [Ruminococcus sp.]